jgi:hypothetical protein
MKVARITAAAIPAAICPVSAVAVTATPVAFAGTDAAVYDFGGQAMVMDGSVVQGWTVSGLKKSSDTVPYAVQGTLWEATATDEAVQDRAVPIVSNLNARTQSGHTYRALFQVATSEGVNPSARAQGEKTTGKLYFDATDEDPDSVVYNDGSRDRAVWVQPPAPIQPATVQTPHPAASRATTDGTDATSAPGPGTVPILPSSQEPVVPAGRQGTPQAPGWQGTPVSAANQTVSQPAAPQGTPPPPGWQGTPVPAANQAVSQAAAAQRTPQAPGWQGTLVSAANQDAPQPAAAQAAPASSSAAG